MLCMFYPQPHTKYTEWLPNLSIQRLQWVGWGIYPLPLIPHWLSIAPKGVHSLVPLSDSCLQGSVGSLEKSLRQSMERSQSCPSCGTLSACIWACVESSSTAGVEVSLWHRDVPFQTILSCIYKCTNKAIPTYTYIHFYTLLFVLS